MKREERDRESSETEESFLEKEWQAARQHVTETKVLMVPNDAHPVVVEARSSANFRDSGKFLASCQMFFKPCNHGIVGIFNFNFSQIHLEKLQGLSHFEPNPVLKRSVREEEKEAEATAGF